MTSPTAHQMTKPIPHMTLALIVLNVVVFLYELSLGNLELQLFFQQWAIRPRQLVFGEVSAEIHTLLTSLFVHGGWTHLFGNMLYLWIFGDQLEARLGHVRFLLFYLLCGLLASSAQVIVEPTSPVAIAGASGAIAGLLGGFAKLLLTSTKTTSIQIPTFFFPTIQLPAILVLIVWFLIQFFNGVAQVGTTQLQTGGVAFFAHIGGFVAGFLLIRIFRNRAFQSDTETA